MDGPMTAPQEQRLQALEKQAKEWRNTCGCSTYPCDHTGCDCDGTFHNPGPHCPGQEGAYHDGKPDVTGADAEALAAADPDHDWRIQLHGPMGGQEYQRHDVGQWVYVKRIPGFA